MVLPFPLLSTEQLLQGTEGPASLLPMNPQEREMRSQEKKQNGSHVNPLEGLTVTITRKETWDKQSAQMHSGGWE